METDNSMVLHKIKIYTDDTAFPVYVDRCSRSYNQIVLSVRIVWSKQVTYWDMKVLQITTTFSNSILEHGIVQYRNRPLSHDLIHAGVTPPQVSSQKVLDTESLPK